MPADEQGVPISLGLFSSLDTEIFPPPEGISPDNQDVMYLPQSVFSRYGTRKALSAPLAGNPQIVYTKSFVQPNNLPLTLILDSLGNLYKEDPINSPGTVTLLVNITDLPTCAQSVTAFGREYIATSDGQHGLGVPLQFDGTNLDRVTQDGPGAGPVAQNFLASPATIAAGTTGPAITITSITPSDPVTYGPPPTPPIIVDETLTIVTAAPHGFSVFQSVIIAGNSNALYNYPFQVSSVINSTTFKVLWEESSGGSGAGGTVTGYGGGSLSRSQNIVSATTTAPHGFQVGWQIAIAGIVNVTIGGSITATSRDVNGISTITTSAANALPVNAQVQITGVTDTTFNGNFTVLSVLSPTQFTVANPGSVASSSAGAVKDIFNGTFYVQSIPTSTTFTYTNVGPNDTATGSGTATPVGNISAGTHGVVVMFQTRNGYITAPSPIVYFSANGAQQVKLGSLPIGPANVVARIIGFTGTGGGNFFYIPVPLTTQTQGAGATTVLQATLIPDNTTTGGVFDFSDTPLFSATAIDIPGRNYFAQVTLGPCLGFFTFASRLVTFGEYTKIQNLLNMSMDGGYANADLTRPLGWTQDVLGGGSLVGGGAWAGGYKWNVTDAVVGVGAALGRISQPAFQDQFGIAILKPNTQYSVRMWSQKNGAPSAAITVDFYSPTGGGTLASAVINPTLAGGFSMATFSTVTPTVIPSDTVLRAWLVSSNTVGPVVAFDEMFIIPTAAPYRNSLLRGSYVNAAEQFDGVTGDFGPTGDTSPLQCCSELRNSLYLNTRRGKHQTTDNRTGEPSTWDVSEITESVGTLGVHGCDPGPLGSGDSGEQWEFCASDGGVHIFAGGDQPKISQEVQGLWDRVNLAAFPSIWVKNDNGNRRLYVGVPLDAATSPNTVLVMDYRNLDSADAIAKGGPIRESMGGKLICREFSRKWTRWSLPLNCGEMLQRPTPQTNSAGARITELAFCAGSGNTGTTLSPASFGNFYSFDPAKLTDDDFGMLVPYYDTYLFPTEDARQQYQLTRRVIADYVSLNLQGTGNSKITPYSNQISNTYPDLPTFALSAATPHDLETDMWVDGERIGLRIGSQPANGAFSITSVVITAVGGAGQAIATFTFAYPVGVSIGSATPSLVYGGSNPEFAGGWTLDSVISPTQIVAEAPLAAFSVGDTSAGGTATISGLTDNAFSLQNLTMTLKSDPFAPVRGAI